MKKIIPITFFLFLANAYSAPITKPSSAPASSPNIEQLGTDTKPLIVKVLPQTRTETDIKQEEAAAKKADDKEKKDEQYREEKAKEDHVLTWATAALALFTLLLWFATYRLAKDAERNAKQQNADMRESLRIAKEAADAANKQFLMLGEQVDTAKKQADIAREEFFATHRPKIRVRHFSVEDAEQIFTEKPFSWRFNISNVGASVASDVYIAYASLWADNPTRAVNVFNEHYRTVQTQLTLQPGEFVKYNVEYIPSLDPLAEQTQFYAAYDMSRMCFYVIGRISYTDKRNITRNTGFVRAARGRTSNYGLVLGDFKQVADTDYEFED